MSQKLKARFEAVLPRIVRHARVVFRYIRCFHTRADKVQEVQGLCWKWVRQLHKAGRKWWTFVSQLATFACKAVKSGRKVVGSIKLKDVMNEINMARKGYMICKLPDISTESTNPLAEAMADNTQSEVPDQVAFRIDFPEWHGRYDQRDRHLIDFLALNHRTQDAARKFKMSEGRVSQLRREFMTDWKQFIADPGDA